MYTDTYAQVHPQQPHQDTYIQQQPQVIVNTVINANNAFISSLDHLPCDIVRSLWIVQHLNIKNDGLKGRVDELLIQLTKLKKDKMAYLTNKDEDEDDDDGLDERIKEITKLISSYKHLINRNSKEAVTESKHLITILMNHKSSILNDLKILDVLKVHKDNVINENRNWEGFCHFKRQFLKELSNNSDNNSGNVDDDVSSSPSRSVTPFVDDSNVDLGPVLKLRAVKNVDNGSLLPLKRKLEDKMGSGFRSARKTPSNAPIMLRKDGVYKIDKRCKAYRDQKLDELKAKRKREEERKEKEREQREHLQNIKLKAKLKIQQEKEQKEQKEQEEQQKRQQEENVYCTCRGPSTGRMIACDNPTCKIEWFHYKCVGLYKDVESGKKWFCSGECEKLYWDRVARKKKRRKTRY